MTFYDREYEVRVLLGDPAVIPPWVQPIWDQIAEALDPLIRLARDRPSVRSTQLSAGPGTPNQKAVSFGRIGWNKQSASKWTHSENGRLISGNFVRFMSCEVWAPSWSACEREGYPPDIFFTLSNEARSGDVSRSDGAQSFGWTCILAVARDMGPDAEGQVERSFNVVASVARTVLRARCNRPWGYPIRDAGATNVIQDLTMAGLFNPGPRQHAPASLAMLKGRWEAV